MHENHSISNSNDEEEEDDESISEAQAFLANGEEGEEAEQMTTEQMMEKIREKRAVIENLRCQPWSMHRKLRTLELAQKYLHSQESKVARSHLFKEELQMKWKVVKRFWANTATYLIPWEQKIKKIESYFGSVVSSYFIFVRWIFWVNIMLSILMISFIVIPECLGDTFANEIKRNKTSSRKILSTEEQESAEYLQTFWDFKGYMAKSPLFYGYYSNEEYILDHVHYRLPLAYFLVNLCVLGYSFFAILRKMASNARNSKLSSGKTEEYNFSWLVFANWDYTIGNPETAGNTMMANVTKLRESIMEYKEKQVEKFRWIRFAMRICANILILFMMASSTYAIYAVVERSKTIENDVNADAFRRNEVPIVVSFITLVFPNFFELISKGLERFHPRTSLRLHLGRILVLYFLNFYTLIFAIFTKMEYYIELQENIQDIPADLISNLTETEALQLLPSGTNDPLSMRFMRDLINNINKASTLSSGDSFVANLTNFTLSGAAIASRLPLYQLLPKQFFGNRFIPFARGSLKQRLIEARIKSFRYAQPEDVRTTTTPSFNFTTIHPEYGTLGVAKVHAFVINETHVNDTDDSAFPTTIQTTFQQHNLSQLQRTSVIPLPQKLQGITSDELGSLCWETMIGQEIAKLITMDLIMTIAAVLVIDFIRGIWVRFCSKWWCWNLETTFPEYGEFKVAENVLHVINNQGMIWLGMFFSPLLPALNNVKLIILMYIRGWAVLTCNIPATEVFRASKSSNFYYMLLLLIMFLCILPVGYVIASKEPSKTCGPFGGKKKFYSILTDQLQSSLPAEIYNKMTFLSSPGIVIPIMILFILVIYFLVALVRGLREANEDLNKQLFQERTEEKRKIFQMAGGVVRTWAAEAKRSSAPRRKLLVEPGLSQSEDTIEVLIEKPSTPPVRQAVHARISPERLTHNSLLAPAVAPFSPSLKSLPEESGSLLDTSETESENVNQKILRDEISKSDTHLKSGKLLTLYDQEHMGLIPSDVQKKQGKSDKPTQLSTLREKGASMPSKLSGEAGASDDICPDRNSLPDIGAKPHLQQGVPVRFWLPWKANGSYETKMSAEYGSEASLAKRGSSDKKIKFIVPNSVKKPKVSSSESFEETEETGEETEVSSLSPSTSQSQSIEVLPALAEGRKHEDGPDSTVGDRHIKLKPIIKHPRSKQRGRRHVPFKPRFILSVSQSCSNGEADGERMHKRYIIRQVPLSPIVERASTTVSSEQVSPDSVGEPEREVETASTAPTVSGVFTPLYSHSESMVEITDLPGSPGTRRRTFMLDTDREESKLTRFFRTHFRKGRKTKPVKRTVSKETAI